MRFVLPLLLTASPIAGFELRAQSDSPPGPASDAASDSVRRWLASNAIRLRTVEAGTGFADMQGLRAVFGEARIVLLGEPTHGNREIYQLKHRMLEFLVEEMDFDVLALETPMAESFDVLRYVTTGADGPEEALAATHVWPWDTEEVAETLEWMRRYNAELTNTRKLTFYGFDMQSPERAARITLTYLDRVDTRLAARARADFGHLAIPFSDPDAGGYRPIVPRDSDPSVRGALGAVLAAFDANKEAWATTTGAGEWAIARQHAHVLAQWVEANRDGSRRYGAVRDSSMAENIRWIVERAGPESKIVVWAHNAHVADAQAAHRSDGTDWAGRHLRRTFGDEMVTVAFLFNRGAFTAMNVAEPSRGLQTFEVGSAPEGTVEAKFSTAGLQIAAIDLRRIPVQGAVAEWFRPPRPTRYSWGDYAPDAPEDYFIEYVAPEAFDAIVYVDSTTATRLLEPSDYGTFPVLQNPINLDFEQSRVGEPPEGWVVWSKLRRFGFEIATSDEQPYEARRAVRIRRSPRRSVGEASGSVLQRVDATAYRGKYIRLRVAARAELANDGVAFLRLRVHMQRPAGVYEEVPDFFDSLDEHRVTSPEWRIYEIVTEVPEDAEMISYGLFVAGAGTAWLDAVMLKVVQE